MLRAALLILGVVLLAAGSIGAVAGWPTIVPALAGAVLVLALLFERYRYKPIRAEPPGPEWERTGERFADPHSGRNVTVYCNPRTGERYYLADGDG